MSKKDPANQDPAPPLTSEWRDHTGILATLERTFGTAVKNVTFSVGIKVPRRVGLFYLEGTTPETLVKELSRRLAKLRPDWLAGAVELPRLMEVQTHPFFPKFQVALVEESILAALSRGEVILAVENDPTPVVGPALFLSCLEQSSFKKSPWRLPGVAFRLFAFYLAVFSAANYIAIVSYQYFALPLKFFLLLAQARLKSPLPSLFEVLLLELLLEIMREGAERIHHPSGLYIGALGGLTVAAGLAVTNLVNPFAALFCATGQVATLVLPIRALLPTIRWLKLGSVVMTSLFGILGAIITASLIVVHLVSVDLAELYPVTADAPVTDTRQAKSEPLS